MTEGRSLNLPKNSEETTNESTIVVGKNQSTWTAEIYKNSNKIPFAKVEVNSTKELFERVASKKVA